MALSLVVQCFENIKLPLPSLQRRLLNKPGILGIDGPQTLEPQGIDSAEEFISSSPIKTSI